MWPSLRRGEDEHPLGGLERLIYEALDAVRSTLGIDPLEDRRAAWLAEHYARLYGALPRRAVFEKLEARVVCCIAAGWCVERLRGCEIVAVADSALGVAESLHLEPDIVFTDGDGGWDRLLRASRRSLTVFHAHGGNAWLTPLLLSEAREASVTVQVPWRGLAWTAPGFTDGDRMLLTCILAGASRVMVTGWCPGRPPHPASGKRLDEWKMAKLRVARVYARLAEILAREMGVELRFLPQA